MQSNVIAISSIFLSYARDDDEAFVHRLHADLIAAGFDVWFDSVSMPSRQLTFHQEIRDAIAARDGLLVRKSAPQRDSDHALPKYVVARHGNCVFHRPYWQVL